MFVYLVTGTTGFIGKSLINTMQQRGMRVKAMVRSGTTDFISPHGPLEFIIADLLKPETLMNAVRGVDVVIHVAGITHSVDKNLYTEINVEGTRNLLMACEVNRVKKIIYISTRAISPLGGAYSRSKIEAEAVIKNASINFTILRLAEVYGGNTGRGIEHLIDNIRTLPIIPIIGNGDYRLQPVYIGDVVNAVISVCALDKTNSKTYNISGSDVFTYNDLIQYLYKYMHVRRYLVHVPAKVMLFCVYLGFFISRKVVIYSGQIPRLISQKDENIRDAQEDFAYNPLSFKDGLKTAFSL